MFVTVPVTVIATLNNGTRQRFRGSYVLRRVNNVDGATAAQLRWHIESARLRRADQKMAATSSLVRSMPNIRLSRIR